MGVGKSVIVDLPQDAAEIFVANPKVANAVVRTPRKLYVIGMDTGQTSVFALDQQGRQIAALELSIGSPRIVSPRTDIDIGGLKQMLHAVMPTAAITARSVNYTIILTGAVDSIEDAQRASDIAKAFLQPIPSRSASQTPTTPPVRRGRRGRAGMASRLTPVSPRPRVPPAAKKGRRPRSSICSPYAAAIR